MTTLRIGLFILVFVLAGTAVQAQPPDRVRDLGNGGGFNKGGRLGNLGNSGAGGSKLDSFQRRDPHEDSITISFRYANDLRRYYLDSAVNEYRRYAVPANHLFLGNTGAPTKPYLFSPIMSPGWDAGYHALDAYRWYSANAKFYRTTRPYSELGYMLGSKSEQVIHLLHTQNIKPDWNVAFDYRMINAPGFFKNQKTNHNNYSLTSLYQGKRRRYAAWVAITGNKLKASDNGGVKILSQLNDPNKSDRFLVATNLADSSVFSRNFFSNKIESGRYEKDFTIWLRQSYDVGQKDSIEVNDSTTVHVFYPRLRFQHTFSLTNYLYNYVGFVRDTFYYQRNYNYKPTGTEGSFQRFEKWRDISNDFSIYQFPDAKNQQQYIRAGATLQLLRGEFRGDSSRNLYNVFIHGEYRNRTRNRKWDIDAAGSFYLNGYNAGDYEARGSLLRLLNGRLGSLQLLFRNVNRTPSFVFYPESSFNLQPVTGLKKENTTQAGVSVVNEQKGQYLGADLFVVNNFTNFRGFYQYAQDPLFNLLRVSFTRTFQLRKWLRWHAEGYLQKVLTGDPHINPPLLYTRHRLAYEGNLGRKNLRLATGLEIKYATPYKLDGWSPLLGQFYYQDSASSRSNLPDIAAYLHFSIKGFNGFLRVENLNTMNFSNGFSFTNNNFAAMLYPSAGMIVRFGIYWRFVN